MIQIDLKGCKSFIKEEDYKEYIDKSLKAFDILMSETGRGNDFLGWKTLPSSTIESKLIEDCEKIKSEWQDKGVDLIVIIGIGGSYLGAKCALEALQPCFSSLLKNKTAPDVVFAGNNMSEEYLSELLDLMKERNVACVVISKSGTTTEPAVAFRIIKHFIDAKYKDSAKRIVAVTDASRGALKTLSDMEGYKTFVIPDNVGGRFSVLTPVGLLPMMLAGIDVRELLEGALFMENELKSKSEDNVAIKYAAMRNLMYGKFAKFVEILVSYNPKLTYFGEWWKQLYGESEGKEGKGLFPASVNFTTDLHSLGQFIQEGSIIMFETVIDVEKSNKEIKIPEDDKNLDQLNFLSGKNVEYCNRMAYLGTKLAHIDGGVPQIVISVDRISPKTLGALFYFFEFACGISAYVLDVNPFDQPGVEAYKKNMFALLEKPGYEEMNSELKSRL